MIVLAIIAVVLLISAGCTLKGFVPTDASLTAFTPETRPIVRHFAQHPATVWTAYEAAIGRTPGMQLRETATGAMLIDLKPTSRILGGNFGLAIRVRFTSTDGGTQVTTDALSKVTIAGGGDSALQHAERTLRMNAKRHQLSELVGEPGR